jgi:FixJ family two-component response regulator
MARNESLTLAVVDDDDDVRLSLSRLLRAIGHVVRLFASAEDFKAHALSVDCLIVDIRLPGVSGLDLRDRLRNRRARVPVLTEPFDADELAEAIAPAMSTAPVERARHAC